MPGDTGEGQLPGLGVRGREHAEEGWGTLRLQAEEVFSIILCKYSID